MLSGEIRSQIDRIWDAFWSGGISNPLEVLEQITYLLFIKRLDDLHALEESGTTRLKRPIIRAHPGHTRTSVGRVLRTSLLPRCFSVVSDHLFPFLRSWTSSLMGSDRIPQSLPHAKVATNPRLLPALCPVCIRPRK
jgi:type I restriction enzyme M protein